MAHNSGGEEMQKEDVEERGKLKTKDPMGVF